MLGLAGQAPSSDVKDDTKLSHVGRAGSGGHLRSHMRATICARFLSNLRDVHSITGQRARRYAETERRRDLQSRCHFRSFDTQLAGSPAFARRCTGPQVRCDKQVRRDKHGEP